MNKKELFLIYPYSLDSRLTFSLALSYKTNLITIDRLKKNTNHIDITLFESYAQAGVAENKGCTIIQ